MRRFGLALALAALTASGVRLAAGQDAARVEADRLAQKLAAITARGSLTPTQLGTPVRTVITDHEVNAYFRYGGKDSLPAGVLNPEVTIEDQRHLTARAMVDLGGIKKEGLLALLPLAGTLEVRASAALDAAHGKGTLQIDSATVGGMPVPQSLLQSIVSHYSKSSTMPNGFELDKPFDLPANIRDVFLQRGSATIVQ